MASLLAAGAAGLAVSFLVERWRRPPTSAMAIHAGMFLLAFLAMAALLQRPYLAGGLVLAFQFLVLAVHEAKRRTLREPMLFSDYGLFSQALRHPRLYLPYLRPMPLLFAAAAFGAAIAASVVLELPGFSATGWSVMLVAALGLLWAGGSLAPALTLDPETDVGRLGLLASASLYWIAERKAIDDSAVPAHFAGIAPALAPSARRPDIVAIECESFFDARRLHGGIAHDVLRNFDALSAAGASGRLTVPAWGANTMRTEFAFLSGIAPERLGVHRFNPYRRFARSRVPTLASHLRALGYRTVCIHPYPASFFGRDRVFPLLGFDEFMDIAAFGAAPLDGPYVADAAVARKIGETLHQAGGPTFVFAITMENHGPQHLEAGPGGDELAVYLRHLRNSDAMIQAVAQDLRASGRDGLLCVYGDHVPSLPAAFARAGYDDPRTDYLVWRTWNAASSRADLRAEALAAVLLREAGLLA
ncbi:MAG: LTA synthase family protein [Candidatus Parcubacteria bacterium]|nr:LTA synthase family protein [Burkholderiales bacterium]